MLRGPWSNKTLFPLEVDYVVCVMSHPSSMSHVIVLFCSLVWGWAVLVRVSEVLRVPYQSEELGRESKMLTYVANAEWPERRSIASRTSFGAT